METSEPIWLRRETVPSFDGRRRKRDTEVYGYARSPQGRDFLRQLLKLAQPRGLSSGKIAIAIADPGSNENAEINLTKSAVYRWINGQSELWKDEPDKSIRYLLRIEALLMERPEFAEILVDQAKTSEKLKAARGLAYVFRRDGSAAEREWQATEKKKLQGIYTAFDIKTSDDESHVVATGTGRFHYFIDVSEEEFLLYHVINARFAGNRISSVLQHLSGFAFPLMGAGISGCIVDNILVGRKHLFQFADDRSAPYFVDDVHKFPSWKDSPALRLSWKNSIFYTDYDQNDDTLDAAIVMTNSEDEDTVKEYIDRQHWRIAI